MAKKSGSNNSANALLEKFKLWYALLFKLVSARSPREKQLIIIFGLIFIVCIDYFLLIYPVVKNFMSIQSQYSEADAELKSLRADRDNRKIIEKGWNQTKINLSETEKKFITVNEKPAFIEKINKLASNSGVKVISLQPFDKLDKTGAKENLGGPYSALPYRMSATGGTHALGKFLAALESNVTFVRVQSVRISQNSADERNHVLELSFEVFKHEANS